MALDAVVFVERYPATRIRAIRPDGIVYTIAGDGQYASDLPAQGVPARAARFRFPYDVELSPDGSVVIVDPYMNIVTRTRPMFPAATVAGVFLPSASGAEGYLFENGRHVKTVDTLTGNVLSSLSYDGRGHLISVVDSDGNTTTIERTAAGVPTAVVAPGGQRTELTVSGGTLTAVTDPASQSHRFTYDGSLMRSHRDPRGNLYQFTWNESGRLERDSDPAGGFISLSRSTIDRDHFEVTRSSAEGGRISIRGG